MLDFGLARQYLISSNNNQGGNSRASNANNNSVNGKDDNSTRCEVRPPRMTAGKCKSQYETFSKKIC